MPIERGNQRSRQDPNGTVPDVSSALWDYFQPLEMMNITKGVNGFEVIETGTVTRFRGLIQPLSNRQLMLKPEGERAWTWLMLHAERVLELEVDDIMTFRGKDTRVMAKKDYEIFGFAYYELVQDWTGSRPLT